MSIGRIDHKLVLARAKNRSDEVTRLGQLKTTSAWEAFRLSMLDSRYYLSRVPVILTEYVYNKSVTKSDELGSRIERQMGDLRRREILSYEVYPEDSLGRDVDV